MPGLVRCSSSVVTVGKLQRLRQPQRNKSPCRPILPIRRVGFHPKFSEKNCDRVFSERACRLRNLDLYGGSPMRRARSGKNPSNAGSTVSWTNKFHCRKTVNGLCKSFASGAEIFVACLAAVVQYRQSDRN